MWFNVHIYSYLCKCFFLHKIPRFTKQFILDPSFKDASQMQPEHRKSHRHACESVANAKEHKEKQKLKMKQSGHVTRSGSRWLVALQSGEWKVEEWTERRRRQAMMRWKQREGLWVEWGRGGDRRTYLAQVIVPPGALLGTETNYTGWTYHRRPVAHFGLNTAVFLELNQIVERIPRTSARTQRNTPSSQ